MSDSPLVFSNTRTQRPNIKQALAKGPRNEKGDPAFTSLDQLGEHFNEDDILFLVNKALYQLDYQKSFHKKRNEEFRLLRQMQAARKTEEAIQEGIANAASVPTTNQLVPPAQKKALVTHGNLASALAKLRKETDEDLGPTGTFDLEPVPPADSLTPDEEARLNAAFAQPKKEATD